MQFKFRSDESPLQAKFFYCICHSCTQINNGIENAIYRLKYIYNDKLKKRNLMEFKFKSDEIPPQAKLFYSMSHNRTQIINGIVNAIILNIYMKVN